MYLILIQVESIWPIDGGLLIERSASTTNAASNIGDQSSVEEGLPVMFTLLHPLDDISPVVCRYPSTGWYTFCACVYNKYVIN